MREMATQKLAQAYRIDEIAASVATMQSASALENVASLVLQRAPSNADAKYVHFFHEKIPSRMMAENTTLIPLNEIISDEPAHAAPFRTRSLTKIFKADHVGAAQDLTEALNICRSEKARYSADKNQLVLAKAAREEIEREGRNWQDRVKDHQVTEADWPRSLELQILFQRGNQYLALACQCARQALQIQEMKPDNEQDSHQAQAGQRGQHPEPVHGGEVHEESVELRENMRKYTKRSLRDYTAFLSNLDYAHTEFQSESKSAPLRNGERSIGSNADANGNGKVREEHEGSTDPGQALIRQRPSREQQSTDNPHFDTPISEQSHRLYPVSDLLSSAPPTGLPALSMSNSSSISLKGSNVHIESFLPPRQYETVTYHPLMPETLHALLLAHCLLQTAPTTLLRIAINVARLTRLADGYPFFLTARSPARADWSEILRKTGDWIGLRSSWDSLCKSRSESDAKSRASTSRRVIDDELDRKKGSSSQDESSAAKKDKIHSTAVMEALGDERVVDDESFQRVVEMRKRWALQELNGGKSKAEGQSCGDDKSNSEDSRKGPSVSKKGANGAVAKDDDYMIGTERAETIVRWILEAPAVIESTGKKSKKGKKRAKGPKSHHDGADVPCNGSSAVGPD